MWLDKLLLVVLCGSCLAQLQDLTRQEGTSGPQVVESVVSLIRESCVFPNDHRMLRRFAYFGTNDGQDPLTYRPGFDGGIWKISQQDFLLTKNDVNLQVYYTDIASRFGVDWNRVQWSDLRKPLYSGLAAALFLAKTFGNSFPLLKEQQGAWYQKLFEPNNIMVPYNFTVKADNLDSGCGSYNLDLAFLVDSSSSVNPTQFQDALTFATDVIDPFVVGPNSAQVALMTFGTGFKTVFDFNDYSDKARVQNAIRQAQYLPGETDTDEALGYAANTLFTPASGARTTSAKVAVVITDGRATHVSDAIARAKELKNKGVIVFVIGVGDQVNDNDLIGLATEPTCTHVQHLRDYQDLGTLRSEIQQLSCRAAVVIQEGNYNFPCDSIRNFRIAIHGNETITINPNNGYVDIYGSFLNAYPNAAFNEFKTRATSSRAAIIYVKDESRPLYLSVVSRGTDPVMCRSGNNYQVNIQNRNAIQPDALITCYEHGILRECTALDILTALYARVEKPNVLGFSSPCSPNHPGYFPYPGNPYRFIYCDNKGGVYVVYCPTGSWYNDNFRQCIPGTPPVVTNPPVVVTTVRPPMSTYIPPVTMTFAPGYNPCTQEAHDRGQRFFPYPQDEHRYIACNEWVGSGVVKACELNKKWSQHDLTCIYSNIPADLSHNLYITSPSPLQVGCSVGMRDGDLFYHPYPPDATKFIQCDQFGNAFLLQCTGGRIWNQNLLTCVSTGLVINPLNYTGTVFG